MSAPVAASTTEHWPAEVLDYARSRQVADLLDPLRHGLERLFPSAQPIRVFLEPDPEIRDERHVVFDVRVSRADVPDFGAAKRRWHDELFRLCPAPLVCMFRLMLLRVS